MVFCHNRHFSSQNTHFSNVILDIKKRHYFDNVDINIILKLINTLDCQKINLAILQKCCDAIALTAQELSRNETFMSPFAKNAMYHGYKDMFGGKEDDITVLLSVVNMTHTKNFNEE